MFVFLFIIYVFMTLFTLGLIAAFPLIGIHLVSSSFMIFGLILWVIVFIVFAGSGYLTHILYLKLKAENTSKAMGIVLTILSILTFIPYGIGYVVLEVILGLKQHGFSSTQKVETKDENGDKHTLEQTYIGSSTYKDENGDYWSSNDGGKTYQRK